MVREEFPQTSFGVMQAFAFNIRRDKFKDARLRQAFNYAFDFEEMNRQLFYGQYKRIDSYFFGTELASSGVPQGMELEILEAVRAQVPADLFTKPYANPVNGNQTAVRNNLRHALGLLREAGYEIRDTKLVDAKTGARFSVEIVLSQPAFERVALFYKPALQRLGIDVSVRTVDTSQYENRLRQWDYDIVVGSWGESLSPGNEQRGYWGSQAADQPGSRNLIGIKNPAVDAHDKSRHLRQEPRGTGGGDACARPRAVVESLCGAAVELSLSAHGALGSLQSPDDHAEICRLGLPHHLVVGQGQGGQGAATLVTFVRQALAVIPGPAEGRTRWGDARMARLTDPGHPPRERPGDHNGGEGAQCRAATLSSLVR